MKILENIALARLTTLGIGGPARWFVRAASEAEIAEACAWARERRVPLFMLGGGSNVLVADAGFDGLVLHVAIQGVELEGELLRAAAGVPWDDCIEQALGANCAGMECLAGIPGTVGGTPVQNVGAYGQEVASVVERVRAFDRAAEKFIEFSNAECGFSYRKSRFNTVDRGRYVVTRVDYRLRRAASRHWPMPISERISRAGKSRRRSVRLPKRCAESARAKACCWSRAIRIAAARGASSRIRWLRRRLPSACGRSPRMPA